MSEPTISDTIESMIAENKALKAQNERLVKALEDLFAMMDEEILVRNTKLDHQPSWSIKAVATVMRLKKAKAVLEEGKK